MILISHPPIGKLVDIGDHLLHIYPIGEGNPTVVFESGGASWSLDWNLVQNEVAKFTSACSYDRAGFAGVTLDPTLAPANKLLPNYILC